MNWVTGKGGVKTWEGPLPEEYEPALQSAEWAINDLVERLSRNLWLRPPPRPEEYRLPATTTTCEDCGCLLGRADARCPGCLWWATKDAVKWSWKQRI